MRTSRAGLARQTHSRGSNDYLLFLLLPAKLVAQEMKILERKNLTRGTKSRRNTPDSNELEMALLLQLSPAAITSGRTQLPYLVLAEVVLNSMGGGACGETSH